MSSRERNFTFAALLFALGCALACARASAQRPAVQSLTGNEFLETKVSEFELHDETVLDGLWKLAKAPSPFAFGFERVLKKKLADPEIRDTRLIIHLENKSVREILDDLCEADPRFSWSMDGATVNVFPRAIRNDNSYLLNRILPKFELKNATDVQYGLLAIVRQVPPPSEQVAYAQIGGGDPYPPKPWSVAYQNLTVRQIVNRLAAHGGPCGIWVFGGAEDFRSFGFFNTYLQCSNQITSRPIISDEVSVAYRPPGTGSTQATQ